MQDLGTACGAALRGIAEDRAQLGGDMIWCEAAATGMNGEVIAQVEILFRYDKAEVEQIADGVECLAPVPDLAPVSPDTQAVAV